MMTVPTHARSRVLLPSGWLRPARQATNGYPGVSNFTTGGDSDAYWYVNTSDATHRCSTNGLTFVSYLQSILGVNADGRWGPATSAALVAALSAAGADTVIVNGVQGEATLRQIGNVSLTAAIWVMLNYQATGSVPQQVSLSQINLPTQTTAPTWDVAATGSGFIGTPTCIVEASSTPVGGGDSTTPASPPAPPSVPTTNTSNTTGGDAPAVPSGVRDVIYQGGSSISWGLIAVLGIGLGVAWWLISDASSKSRTTRRAPRRSSRRRAAA